jgi:hypothetical protein
MEVVRHGVVLIVKPHDDVAMANCRSGSDIGKTFVEGLRQHTVFVVPTTAAGTDVFTGVSVVGVLLNDSTWTRIDEEELLELTQPHVGMIRP